MDEGIKCPKSTPPRPRLSLFYIHSCTSTAMISLVVIIPLAYDLIAFSCPLSVCASCLYNPFSWRAIFQVRTFCSSEYRVGNPRVLHKHKHLLMLPTYVCACTFGENLNICNCSSKTNTIPSTDKGNWVRSVGKELLQARSGKAFCLINPPPMFLNG